MIHRGVVHRVHHGDICRALASALRTKVVGDHVAHGVGSTVCCIALEFHTLAGKRIGPGYRLVESDRFSGVYDVVVVYVSEKRPVIGQLGGS